MASVREIVKSAVDYFSLRTERTDPKEVAAAECNRQERLTAFAQQKPSPAAVAGAYFDLNDDRVKSPSDIATALGRNASTRLRSPSDSADAAATVKSPKDFAPPTPGV
jgi:hypothetical protein